MYFEKSSIVAFQRYGARTDSNQKELVNSINQIPGVDVIDLSGAAKGVPDLLIQRTFPSGDTKLYLVEVKTKIGRLNKLQVAFHNRFHCHVARTIDDIMGIIGL